MYIRALTSGVLNAKILAFSTPNTKKLSTSHVLTFSIDEQLCSISRTIRWNAKKMSLFFLLYLSPLAQISLSLWLSSSSLIAANLRRYRSCHQSRTSLSMSRLPSSTLSISTSFTLSFSSISLFQTNLLISAWVVGWLIFCLGLLCGSWVDFDCLLAGYGSVEFFFFFSSGYGEF